MVRWLLTPRWLAIHLLALVLVAACVLLGRWQLDRAADFRHSASSGSEPPPVPMQSITAVHGSLAGAAVGRLVTVTGVFDPDHAYVVPNRAKSGRPGRWVLDVLRVPTGAGVLVVRGWLPDSGQAAVAVPPVPRGAVEVTGRLMPSEDPGGGVAPGTVLPTPEIAAANPVDLLSLVHYPLYDGYVVLRSQSPPADVPLDLVPSPKVGNDVPGFYFQHVAYVALWWLFGAFVVFFWWRLVRDETRPRSEAAEVASSAAD